MASRRHIVFDASRQTLRCCHCDGEVPMPLGALRWTCAVGEAFSVEHENCRPGDVDNMRTAFLFSKATFYQYIPESLRIGK